jgi:hypothetical protein
MCPLATLSAKYVSKDVLEIMMGMQAAKEFVVKATRLATPLSFPHIEV